MGVYDPHRDGGAIMPDGLFRQVARQQSVGNAPRINSAPPLVILISVRFHDRAQHFFGKVNV